MFLETTVVSSINCLFPSLPFNSLKGAPRNMFSPSGAMGNYPPLTPSRWWSLGAILFLLSLWVLILPLQGRGQTTSFINYGVEEGLPQSQVQTILQDNNSNLWIGTLAGLTRYNGKSFFTYYKKDGLAEDWITSSYKDRQGNLWFGHWAGGVSRYNWRTRRIEDLHLEEFTKFKTIRSITEDKMGKIWIGTQGSGVFIYDPATNRMSSLMAKDGLCSNNIYDICNDSLKIWIATDSGITVYDAETSINSQKSFTCLRKKDGLPSNHITSLRLINGNEIWLGTADAGIAILNISDYFQSNKTGASLKNKLTYFDQHNGLGSNFIESIYEDSGHNVWVATTGGGVTKCTPFKSSERKEALRKAILYVYNTKQGLNYFNANAVFEDNEKNVWIGTDIGLNQYRGERFQIYDESDSLRNNLVWATLCDSDGNIWLGTNDGLSKITFSRSPFNNQQKRSIKNFTTKEGLKSNVVLSLHEDSYGNIWIGTLSGICMLEKGKNIFKSYSSTEKDGLKDNTIFAINSDNKGNIWFGTKQGASMFNPSTSKFKNYTTINGLGGNYVYRIFKDSKGNLWFGSLGGNLSMFNGTGFKKFDESTGLLHSFILCISEDKKGNLWFGAHSGGLYKYDGKSFENFTMKDGMWTDSPYSTIVDNDDNLWIGNGMGLDKFDTGEKQFIHYGKQSGFPGVEANPNAGCIDKEGNIWMGTIMGAVRFNPSENKPNKVEPQTFINDLKIFMKEANFPEDGRFSYDENHLTFNFIGVSLTNPHKVLYQYKLQGFDKDWLPGFSALNEAVYSNIPPGNYTFLVKACNNDGVWNINPTKYSFSISPPFWQTATFYLFIFLFVIFSFYGFDKVRTKKLQTAKKNLEEKVENRTMELAYRNAELAEKNKDITDSIRYAKKIQETILPSEKIIKKYLPESFILFKPKDIVSGDFYWLEGRKNESVLFAAIDCTGHGVPGAFMSIVAHNLINLAIESSPAEVQPSMILDHLNKSVSQTLKKTHPEGQRPIDGMDVSMCSLNYNKMELLFAGAHNSLYLIRKNEVLETKGDLVSIGTYNGNGDSGYTNHKINLEKGDSIYIFSDGYIDQFGGPNGKKFKSDQFKELLLSIHEKTSEEQKNILESTLEQWRDGLEQVDDILVMGVKIK